jgi:hypothetical protein
VPLITSQQQGATLISVYQIGLGHGRLVKTKRQDWEPLIQAASRCVHDWNLADSELKTAACHTEILTRVKDDKFRNSPKEVNEK